MVQLQNDYEDYFWKCLEKVILFLNCLEKQNEICKTENGHIEKKKKKLALIIQTVVQTNVDLNHLRQ